MGASASVASFSGSVSESLLSERYQGLIRVSQAIGAHRDPIDLFRAITTELHQVVQFDGIVVTQYDEASDEILWNACEVCKQQGPVAPPDIPADETIAKWVFLRQEPLVIPALDRETRFPRMVSFLREKGFQSVCALPLTTAHRRVGTLAMASLQPDAYCEEEVRFLSLVAGQVAIALENALAYREIAELKDRLAQEKVYLQDEIRSELNFEEIVGRSPALRKVLQEIETVAPTDSTVLIYGETGTGKELIARAIHNLGRRSAANFVKLNCAAIPTGLLESEMFGHEKGAFTGAVAQRIGRFELAHHGTVFLDEIGEIPLELQPKLLRVLQEREFERLGSCGPCAPTPASSPPPTATWRRWSMTASFAPTSSTVSTSFPFTSRPCASGRKTSRCWSATLSSSSRAAWAKPWTPFPPRACVSWSATSGPATSANCRT
jgi:formate hydrogenlyase transcriptional activator